MIDLQNMNLTRRRFAGGLALSLGGLAAVSDLWSEAPQQKMQQAAPSAARDHRTSLHQEVELPASASRIERVLLDAKEFAAFTGWTRGLNRRKVGHSRFLAG